MKKTIYFHVGTVKTGSTLIQKVLWENRKLLQKFNFHYFDLVEPKLKYPRYANAEFLFDKLCNVSDQEIRTYINNIKSDNIIISEEGLWANMDMLSNPIFDGYDKKIILYVRKPIDLVAAWASENAEPYNARGNVTSTGVGIVSIDEGIIKFTNMYINIFKNFFKHLENLKKFDIIIRPYDREQFENKDILQDFLKILGIDIKEFLKDKEFQSSNVANISKSRKYCDISTSVWELIKFYHEENNFTDELVDYIYKNCRSGDDRAVIQTLKKEVIISIYKELQYVENEISLRYLNGKQLFENSLPDFISSNSERLSYQPVSQYEIKTLFYKFYLEKYDCNLRTKQETLEETKRIDLIRDIALKYEQTNDIDIAYGLMKIAHKLRPTGSFIEEKFLQYKKILEKIK